MLKLFILYHHFRSLTMNIHKFWHFYLMIEAVTVGGVRWMVSLPPTSSRTRALNRESLFKTCGGWCSTMKVLKNTVAFYEDRWNYEHYSLIYGVSICTMKFKKDCFAPFLMPFNPFHYANLKLLVVIILKLN